MGGGKCLPFAPPLCGGDAGAGATEEYERASELCLLIVVKLRAQLAGKCLRVLREAAR